MPTESGLKELGWIDVLRGAQALAATSRARSEILALEDTERWAPTVALSHQLQKETHEVLAVLGRDAWWSALQGLRGDGDETSPDAADPENGVVHLERGGVLGVEQWHLLRRWIRALSPWAEIPVETVHAELGHDFLQPWTLRVHALWPTLERVLRILRSVITDAGQMSDQASPQLTSLNRRIRAEQSAAQDLLRQLMQRHAEDGNLQDKFTDVRGDRYVLPVKSSHQGEVPGRVMDTSVSRQTVYIEPLEMGEVTSRLKRLEAEREEEIYRILREVSGQCRPFAAEIRSGLLALVELDVVQARARLARAWGGRAVWVQADGNPREIHLVGVAHPGLLDSLERVQVVRSDLHLEDGVQMLLISGPNTGGKTVLLKTVGLAAIFSRTGFFLPAAEDSSVPFYDAIFVDLGDAQSIEAHLSSFSGHILKLKSALESLTPQSLVLLDELNSATDPEEGAALSRAIVEAILNFGPSQVKPMVIATTHDPTLKVLGTQDRRILSASMSFDEDQNTPTYRVVYGLPGRSRALATAKRLGIPTSILERAASYLQTQHQSFELALEELQRKLRDAQDASRQAGAHLAEVQQLREQWQAKARAGWADVLDQARKRIRTAIEGAEEELRSEIRTLAQAGRAAKLPPMRQALSEASSVLESRAVEVLQEEVGGVLGDSALELRPDGGAGSLLSARGEAAECTRVPEVGEVVRLPKWKNLGTVVEVRGKRLKVALGLPGQKAAGALTTWVEVGQYERVSAAELRKRSRAIHAQTEVETNDVPSSLDLRGKRLEEAMSELERYLDRALRAGRREVTIIHGLGTGVLREGTLKHLRALPYVRAVSEGGTGGGGTAATRVELG